ncbi:TraR/DksA family transcriptional regulator [Massilia arenosa]|uniref:TraR/DksA family transcriptional regulator n=1 Tax=Zemynaea arenosa TaxID=2561931 RepID=A0A4Y9S8Y6_9BURK|nr:TraR/DksA family transcriptional regulator [Massilia arenosa]TFW16017.1 TraR/DksA family transcriptional regulator [Massilia arenosa]
MPLTHDQREQLRRQLEQRRAELEEQAAADPINRDEMPIADQEFSPADAATNRLLTDLALGDAGRHLSALALVRNALTRLHEGSYGLCEACGNDIGFARLQARPEAQLCIACQSRAEKRGIADQPL